MIKWMWDDNVAYNDADVNDPNVDTNKHDVDK